MSIYQDLWGEKKKKHFPPFTLLAPYLQLARLLGGIWKGSKFVGAFIVCSTYSCKKQPLSCRHKPVIQLLYNLCRYFMTTRRSWLAKSKTLNSLIVQSLNTRSLKHMLSFILYFKLQKTGGKFTWFLFYK